MCGLQLIQHTCNVLYGKPGGGPFDVFDQVVPVRKSFTAVHQRSGHVQSIVVPVPDKVQKLSTSKRLRKPYHDLTVIILPSGASRVVSRVFEIIVHQGSGLGGPVQAHHVILVVHVKPKALCQEHVPLQPVSAVETRLALVPHVKLYESVLLQVS